MIWNVALAALLVWLCQRRRVRAPGCFALYVAGYSAFGAFWFLVSVIALSLRTRRATR